MEPGPLYYVSEADQDTLLRLWDSHFSSPNRGSLELAIRRWDDSMFRVNVDDKFIDYWVILENIYSRERDELRLRLALRISIHQYRTPGSRLDGFRRVKKSYDVRSAILHGSEKKRSLLQDQVDEAKEWARNAIVMLMMSKEEFNCKNIEEEFLANAILPSDDVIVD